VYVFWHKFYWRFSENSLHVQSRREASDGNMNNEFYVQNVKCVFWIVRPKRLPNYKICHKRSAGWQSFLCIFCLNSSFNNIFITYYSGVAALKNVSSFNEFYYSSNNIRPELGLRHRSWKTTTMWLFGSPTTAMEILCYCFQNKKKFKNFNYIASSSRNNRHCAQICTNILFYILAPTCFGSSLSLSGSFWIHLSYSLITADHQCRNM
jgi:hypothetical protein